MTAEPATPTKVECVCTNEMECHCASRLVLDARDLVSRHREGCPHYRDAARNIFDLSDEDSYDVCTCLRNFVPASKLEPLKETRAVLLELAPFVAVFARNVMVSPETRDLLLKLEPRMLAALLATKET